MSIGLFAVWYFGLQYDAGGGMGLIWWLVFLLGFPFNIAREYIAEFAPNLSHSIEALLSYILASFAILILYVLLSYIFRMLENTNKKGPN